MGEKELKYYLKKLECSYSVDDNLLGDTLLLSGAGGGKTTTLVNRVNALLNFGIDINNILVLTFTKKSANDFKNRVNENLLVSTFHAFAFNLLKKNGIYFKILTNNEKLLIDSYLEHERLSWFTGPFLCYNDFLSFNGIIERLIYDLKCDLTFKNQICREYPFILVDEYQDSDSLQIEFLKILNSGGCKITVAGDNNQSIYSFRGGSYKNILLYKKDFPEGKLIKFEKNYRSTVRIVNFCNDILDNITLNISKKNISQKEYGHKPKIIEVSALKDEGEYLSFLIKELLIKKKSHETIGVIYRNKNLVKHLEKSFNSHNILYNKQVPLSNELNILDEFNVFKNFLNRVNSINLEKMRHSIFENRFEKSIKTSDILKEIELIKNNSVNFLDINKKNEFGRYFFILNFFLKKKYIISSSSRDNTSLELLIKSTYSKFYWDKLDLKFRLETIHKFEEISRNPIVLNSCDTEPLNSSSTNLIQSNYIDLITTHSSKGLEWDYVFLTSVTEGVYPSSSNNIEEELRLFYVGCSRSKKELTLIAPQRIHWFLNDLYNTSSFISSLNPNNYDLINKTLV